MADGIGGVSGVGTLVGGVWWSKWGGTIWDGIGGVWWIALGGVSGVGTLAPYHI